MAVIFSGGAIAFPPQYSPEVVLPPLCCECSGGHSCSHLSLICIFGAEVLLDWFFQVLFSRGRRWRSSKLAGVQRLRMLCTLHLNEQVISFRILESSVDISTPKPILFSPKAWDVGSQVYGFWVSVSPLRQALSVLRHRITRHLQSQQPTAICTTKKQRYHYSTRARRSSK